MVTKSLNLVTLYTGDGTYPGEGVFEQCTKLVHGQQSHGSAPGFNGNCKDYFQNSFSILVLMDHKDY